MDEDIETFIERHGVEKIFDVLDHLHDYLNGQTNARIVSHEENIKPIEAEIVLQFLRRRFLK